ncbi:ABC transporter ATPase [Fictibacillus phosphorivorans]|uniref:ABC transporter ATPase n=1 Tax=Fictibacillus phosphorivorans TaxID=1221500 RepID=UPI003CEFCA2F
MFNKLSVEEFAVLKGPLESGRQSPQSLGGVLVLGAAMQALAFYLIYSVAAESSVYPNIEGIRNIHLWTTVILSVLSIIYAIPYIYKRSEKTQYLLSIISSQNIGSACMYLGALFVIGADFDVTEESLIKLTFITLGFAIALFILTFVRFYILLHKGQYREGSARGKIRERFETTSYIPMAIVLGMALVYIIQYLIRAGGLFSLETFFLTVLPLLVFYTMVFVLPEQLVILYCKFRFKSFNFDRNGYLYSESVTAKDKSLRV